MEWLEAQGSRWTTWAAEKVAALADDGKALARLTWLRGRGYPADKAAHGAGGGGNKAALQYLLAEVPGSNAYDSGPKLPASTYAFLEVSPSWTKASSSSVAESLAEWRAPKPQWPDEVLQLLREHLAAWAASSKMAVA
ncbi:hypothetical protein GPECTOR_2g1254 [Gonium pectorale]|uniref:Uncharacterized protein n=1 Tax=Gonium pectorale TaxID=33097 RepID=A0A150H0Y8_GONPE|nr:hypothetical protein GPECTOR_2g1254 [Gonium pectorale]|eukprot:KXZ55704.1 hypothetical protein GPECTOR_2g1254 [Gonium pectorale]